MIKRCFWLPASFLIMSHFIVSAQNESISSDSFQKKYKEDLFEIIKEDTAFIRFFPEDKSFITEATVTLISDEQPFEFLTSSGKKKAAQKYALLTFGLKGQTFRLYAYQLLSLKDKEETAHHLFIPFTDNTNITTSYGGGRYIDAETSDIINGKLMLDFNRAYNPYCAFTTGYNCPIPPRENSLDIEIEAGESYNAAHFSHDND